MPMCKSLREGEGLGRNTETRRRKKGSHRIAELKTGGETTSDAIFERRKEAGASVGEIWRSTKLESHICISSGRRGSGRGMYIQTFMSVGVSRWIGDLVTWTGFGPILASAIILRCIEKVDDWKASTSYKDTHQKRDRWIQLRKWLPHRSGHIYQNKRYFSLTINFRGRVGKSSACNLSNCMY